MGRNRRYYQLTNKGWEMYGEYLREWKEFRSQVDRLMTPGPNLLEERTDKTYDQS